MNHARTTLPLDGARVGVTGNRKGAELARLLARQGATALLGPTLSGDKAAPDEELAADTATVLSLEPGWLVATTGVGMRFWAEAADRQGVGEELRAFSSQCRSVARGAKAVGGMASLGVRPVWTSPNNTDRDVVAWLRGHVLPGESVVVQLHGGHSTAYDELRSADLDLVTVMPYRWELPADPEPAVGLVSACLRGELDVIVFTSAGAVRNLFVLAAVHLGEDKASALRRRLAGDVAVAAVGPVTAEAVEAEGGIVTVLPRRWRTADLVRALARWWQRPEAVVVDPGLRLRPESSSVACGGRSIALGPREYAVLAALLRRPGVLVRTSELLTEAWGHAAPADPASVKHQVSRLRRKLDGTGVAIHTVRGLGYRMEVDS